MNHKPNRSPFTAEGAMTRTKGGTLILIIKRAFILLFLALHGIEARSWLGLKERNLGNMSVGREASAGTNTDSSRGTSSAPTTTTATSSSQMAAASTSSAETGSSSPTESSTDTRAGSGAPSSDGTYQDGTFWGGPSDSATHHLYIDYNHPGRHV